jgi:hypothetical protein
MQQAYDGEITMSTVPKIIIAAEAIIGDHVFWPDLSRRGSKVWWEVTDLSVVPGNLARSGEDGVILTLERPANTPIEQRWNDGGSPILIVPSDNVYMHYGVGYNLLEWPPETCTVERDISNVPSLTSLRGRSAQEIEDGIRAFHVATGGSTFYNIIDWEGLSLFFEGSGVSP